MVRRRRTSRSDSATMMLMASLRSAAEQSPAHSDDREPPRVELDFVVVPSPNLETHVRQTFENLGEEYHELCERLFVGDPDLSLA